MTALDALTGLALGSFATGPMPAMAVVDAPAGEALTLDANGGSVTFLSETAGGTTQEQRQTPAERVAPDCRGGQFFRQTGHSLSGAFLAFWRRYGGLDTFGYPQTEQFVEHGRTVQYTDRFQLYMANGVVHARALGRALTAQRGFKRSAPFPSSPARLYFAATGHSLSGPFLASGADATEWSYWGAHLGGGR